MKAGALSDADTRLAAVLREPRLLPDIPDDSIEPIVDRAERHGVAGVLLDRARRDGLSLGAGWSILRERAARQSGAAALRDAESLAVVRHATALGLQFVVLKGLALAYSVYPEPWLRERSDTDVLVHESDVPRFDRLFSDLGYTLLPHVRGELTLPQRHYQHDDRMGFRHAWDLHWRLTSSQALRFALPEDEVWARAVSLAALGGARVPSRADALLLACVHRLAHHFDDPRLIWLWDIRLLIESLSPEELESFARLAGRPASAAACGRSLAVAAEHAGAVIPEQLRPLPANATGSTTAFLWSGSRRRVTYLWGELRAARREDRFRLLREHLLPSFSSMRDRYPSIPAPLLPLAYFWRLMAGIPKWVRVR